MSSSGQLAPTPFNWSFHAIPASYILGLLPHYYGMVRMMVATGGKISIANPRSNLETLRPKLSTALYTQLCKARGAHLNGMEVFPLFAAAVVAGNVAHVPAQDMNTLAWSFLGLRVLYTGLYVGVRGDILSIARSSVWGCSVIVPMAMLWRTGRIWAERENVL